MANLEKWKEKMKEKRKNTPFRNYLKTIVCFRTLGFYKNSGFTTVYPPNTNRIRGVTSHKEFHENRDTLVNHGIDYSFDKGFFDNFKRLFLSVDFAPTILFGECENADFTDQTVSVKNCYLSFVVIKGCENVLYSFSIKENSMNVFNSVMVWDHCENIYLSKGVIKSYNTFYSKHIINSANIWFSTNLMGCSECILCDNLENQSYCIENKKLEKEAYFVEKQRLLEEKQSFLSRYEKLNNRGNNYGSTDINGIFNIQCENVENGGNNYQIKNGRNIMFVGGKDSGENIYDCFLNTPPETNMHGVIAAGYCDNVYNSYQITGGSNIYYSYFLEACSFCLGCIGLKNKSYCILNKQYTKEEWYLLADKIFAQMDKDGILGDFFPGSLNPFYFNDTAAALIDSSFTKEEVEAEGYMWRDEPIKVDVPDVAKVIGVKDLDQYQGYDAEGNWKISDEILEKVIRDEQGNFYRIVPMEYDFLMKHGLPLPEIHWLDRIKMGFRFQ